MCESKISKETMWITASNLTIAEMILGIPGPNQDTIDAPDPGKIIYETFKEHLKRLEEECP